MIFKNSTIIFNNMKLLKIIGLGIFHTIIAGSGLIIAGIEVALNIK